MDTKNTIKFFNDLAPSWDNSKKQTNQEIDQLLKRLPIKLNDKVLDVGCGTGIITNNLFNISNKPVLGIDISSKMIDIAKQKHKNNQNISFLCMNFTEFKGSDYDFVVIFNAYPHFIDTNLLKQTLLSVLKPGGKFAILHDLSLEELTKIHEGISSSVSRNIERAKVEASFFEPEFRIIETKEDTHLYYILVEKK